MARIARTMEKQGTPVRNIIVTILIATGFAAITCKLAGGIRNTLGILRIIRQIALVLAAAGATNAIIVWLSRARRVPIPVVSTIIGWLLVFFLAIRALSKGAAGLASDLESIEDTAGILDDWCDEIRARIPGI